MSEDPKAILFYGYAEPLSEDDDESDDDEETPWSEASYKKTHNCTVELYGTSCQLGHFLAVEESLHQAEYSNVCKLRLEDFEVKPEWDEQLVQAATEFNIDLTEPKPSWNLVSLYF